MSQVQIQWEFLKDLSRLIEFASTLEGVQMSGGDLYQDNDWCKRNCENKTIHLKTGYHPRRRAIDLNLFVDGVYITGFHDVWEELGRFWELLNPKNRWGGRFTKKDYNHFERT